MTNPAWTPLFAHGTRLETTPLGVLLKDEQRNQRLRHSLGGCLIDFSRQHVDLETLQSLAKLTRESGVYALRDALFSEQNINLSEDRAVLHPALRDGIEGLSSERAEAIAVTRDRLYALAESLRCGSWRGSTGKAIEDVVHIGIGGSHLGPELLVRALDADGNEVARQHTDVWHGDAPVRPLGQRLTRSARWTAATAGVHRRHPTDPACSSSGHH